MRIAAAQVRGSSEPFSIEDVEVEAPRDDHWGS